MRDDLEDIQSHLFLAGAWLATTPNSSATGYLTTLPANVSKDLERRIDALSEVLPVLKEFILPGGTRAAALAHLVRSVCRRVERRIVHLANSEEVSEMSRKYLNRLSDLMFILGRVLNKAGGCTDVLWLSAKNRGSDQAG